MGTDVKIAHQLAIREDQFCPVRECWPSGDLWHCPRCCWEDTAFLSHRAWV